MGNSASTRQAGAQLLGRLQRLGLVEQHKILRGVVVYQPTRRGYDLAEEQGIATRYLPKPSAGTLEHTLQVVDLLISWEPGRGWLPEGLTRPVTVISEREITAADKAPAKTPKRARPAAGQYVAGGVPLPGEDMPVYAYRVHRDDRWTLGYPDALRLPAGWQRGEPIAGAIAIEVERTDKDPADYRSLLRAYDRERHTGRYAHVLYISHEQSYLDKITTAAEVAGLPPGFLQTLLMPSSWWDRQPERTTPARPRTPRADAPVDQHLRAVPKARLVEALMAAGTTDAVLAVLDSSD